MAPSPPVAVGTVSLTPAEAQVEEGGTVQIQAVVRGTDGSSLTDRPVTWATSDAAIATVSTTGLVTGTGHGTATITATAEGRVGSALVSVRGAVASITISPGSPVVAEDAQLQLSATPRSRNGVVLSDRPITWTSSAAATAQVSPAGMVTGLTDGVATITATSEGQSTSVDVDVRAEVASVTVTPAQVNLNEPEAVTLSAVVRSAKGTTLTRRTVTWSTSDAAIAAVDPLGALSARGRTTGHGTATILGTVDGVTGAATLTVRGMVARIVVAPPAVHFVSGQSRSFTAQTFSRNDVLLTDRPTTWATSDPNVARLLPGAIAEAVSPGAATIRVTAEGTLGTAAVTVHPIVLGGASYEFTCAMIQGLASYCWGYNEFGVLGDGTVTSSPSPVRVATSVAFAALIPMGSATYGVTPAGEVYAWGSHPGGRSRTPEPIPAITGMGFHQYHAGFNFACGLAADHFAYCWGNNEHGQLGDGSLSPRPAPGPPVGAGLPLAALSRSTSLTHACGLTSAGRAYCWGFNTFGQLGDGTTIDRSSPVAVATAVPFVELATGLFHTCGRTALHEVWCWGTLPGGSATSTVPVLIATQPPLAAMTGGQSTACVLTTAGEARCWGFNGYGAIGDGTAIDRTTPTAVGGGLRFATLSEGSLHVCGVTHDGRMYCWGGNQGGEVGDGTLINRFLPTAVRWPVLP